MSNLFIDNNMTKSRCICGYCAPKAETREDFENIMKKHVDSKIEFTYNNNLNDK